MMGQIVNRNERGVLAGPKECFIPNMGTTIPIMGQVEFFVKTDNLKRIKKIKGLVTNDQGQEILIDEHTLREWSIIPPNFPEPMDEREKARVISQYAKLVEIHESKGSKRTSIPFIAVNDDEIDIDKKLKELKKRTS